MTDKTPAPPRCAVLIGPYLSGKTTLLEALLSASGAIHRKGSITEGNTVGDSSPEARARQMSVEPNFAHGEYLNGDTLTFEFTVRAIVSFFDLEAPDGQGLVAAAEDFDRRESGIRV